MYDNLQYLKKIIKFGADGQFIVFSIVLHDFIHIVFSIFSMLLFNTLSFKFIQDILKSFYIALLFALLFYTCLK